MHVKEFRSTLDLKPRTDVPEISITKALTQIIIFLYQEVADTSIKATVLLLTYIALHFLHKS